MDDLCINPIHRIGLIHKSSIDSRYIFVAQVEYAS